MKFNLIVDKSAEPSVTVVCSKVDDTVCQIERLCNDAKQDSLWGYAGEEVELLHPSDIVCFFTDGGVVSCWVGSKKYLIKQRIKVLTEMLPCDFVKINQGCICNVKHVKKFAVSVGGSLQVVFDNGYSDYVSRREITSVKRRFGL